MTEIEITPKPADRTDLAASPVVAVYSVHGMSCGNCAAHVVKTFLTLGSVQDSLPAINDTWKS